MSFILDALKKSESDRQRQSGPSLFEVKVAPPRRRLPVWAVAIAVLLGVNIVVVSWMLLRHPAAQAQQPAAGGRADSGGERPDTTSGPEAPQPGAGAANGTASAANAAAARAGAPAAGVASQSSGASADGRGPAAPPATAHAAARSGQSLAAAPEASGNAQGAGEPPAGQAPAENNPSDYAPAVEPAAAPTAGLSGSAAGDLPIYQQIVTSDGLPSLHLDLHVFADRPRDRFVMINMHRLGEGDSLPGGVQVEAIRPDGVVLTYHGTRFLLPRN